MLKTSRRAVLAGAATLPALAIPAIGSATSAAPDPVLGAIDNYRRAYASFTRAIDHLEELQERYGYGSPETEAAELDKSAACSADHEAARNLCAVAPTTMQGLIRRLAFVSAEHQGGNLMCDDDSLLDLVTTTSEALRTMGVRS